MCVCVKERFELKCASAAVASSLRPRSFAALSRCLPVEVNEQSSARVEAVCTRNVTFSLLWTIFYVSLCLYFLCTFVCMCVHLLAIEIQWRFARYFLCIYASCLAIFSPVKFTQSEGYAFSTTHRHTGSFCMDLPLCIVCEGEGDTLTSTLHESSSS